MGRFPLPRVSPREGDLSAIEIWPAARALLPGPPCPAVAPAREEICPRRRTCHRRWWPFFLRRIATSPPSRRQSRAEIGGSPPCNLHCFGSARKRCWQIAAQSSAARTADGAGEIRGEKSEIGRRD